MAFRTEKQYREACDELVRQVEEGIIPGHSFIDAFHCIIKEMWDSDWWKQKNKNKIIDSDELMAHKSGYRCHADYQRDVAAVVKMKELGELIKIGELY